MKVVIYSVVAVALVVGAFFAFNAFIYNEKKAGFVVGETVKVSGLVVGVDQEQILFDGPYALTLQVGEGTIESYETIEVPSMGMMSCLAYEQIRIVSDIVMDSRITVTGERAENGSIVPCSKAEHILQIDSVPALDVSEAVDATDTIRARVLEEVSLLYPEALSIAITDIRVIQWGDTCFGIEREGEVCYTEVVPGYVISVYVDEESKEFRTDLEGSVLLEA